MHFAKHSLFYFILPLTPFSVILSFFPTFFLYFLSFFIDIFDCLFLSLSLSFSLSVCLSFLCLLLFSFSPSLTLLTLSGFNFLFYELIVFTASSLHLQNIEIILNNYSFHNNLTKYFQLYCKTL